LGIIYMHALVLLCIDQHTNFEVPALSIPKIWLRPKSLKTGHVTLTTPF